MRKLQLTAASLALVLSNAAMAQGVAPAQTAQNERDRAAAVLPSGGAGAATTAAGTAGGAITNSSLVGLAAVAALAVIGTNQTNTTGTK